MKLNIKQKLLTLGEEFSVKDETGSERFFVKGSFMEIVKNFSIYDEKHTLVARIERQLFRFMAHYDIDLFNDTSITLKRSFTFLNQAFEILGSDWRIESNFTRHHYQIVQGERPVMELHKEWFTWGDEYVLSIEDERDALLCLCIAIAIDEEISRDDTAAASAGS